MGERNDVNTNSSGLNISLHIHQSEESNVLGHPKYINYEINAATKSADPNQAPLPYFTDALLGLSAYNLSLRCQDYSASSEEERLVSNLWQGLEPMHEIYNRSFQRIKLLLHNKLSIPSEAELKFEKSMNEILRSSCKSDGIDLVELLHLIDSLDYLETKRNQPFLFDTNIHFSNSTMDVLHTLNSLLYNLRALTAIYYNSKRKEPLYESLHLDSIKDYFHAPDLLTNDTMLCHQFIQLKQKGQLTGGGEIHLEKGFKTFLPHSYQLIQSLPESFFTNQNSEQLEQSIYSFQIDWLLGTPSGLLYRIREELNGLREGYEQTFWPELINTEAEEVVSVLHVNCLLSAIHIQQLCEVAA